MNLLLFNLAVDREHVTLAFALSWIEDLATRFDHIDVVTMTKGDYALPDNVTVWSLGRERGFPEWLRLIRFYWIVLSIMRRRRIHVVFTHMIPIFAVLFWPVAQLTGIKNVMWYAHGATPRTLKWAHATVDQVVTSTPEGFRLPSSKVIHLGQGIRDSAFYPLPRVRSDRPKLITVGRLAPSKGVELMLETLASYRAESRPFLTVVGGSTNSAEEEHGNAMRDLAVEMGLSDCVSFLGRRDEPEVADLLRQSDVFINLSTTGSLDKAIVEAMACECIVVSTNAAFASIAKREGFENCVPLARDVNSLIKVLEYLDTMPEDARQTLAANQASVARRDHGRARFIEQLSTILLKFAKSA